MCFNKNKIPGGKAADLSASNQWKLHLEFDALLRAVLTRPTLWKDDSLRYLRNFCHAVSSRPDVFPPMLMGDQNAQLSVNSDGSSDDFAKPIKGYIAAFAARGDTSKLTTTPILLILMCRTGYKDVMRVDNKAIKDFAL